MPFLIEIISWILSTISLFFGLFTIIKSPSGILGGVVWLPKLWAGAWASFLAMAGVLGAVLGAITRDYYSLAAGLLGAALEIRHILIVTRHQDGLTRAFGADFDQRIPVALRSRLGTKRYRLVQPASPAAPGQRDVDLGASGSTDQRLLCDIWQPPPKVPRTGLALVYLHGGLWQALDKDFLTRPLFRRLANQGHVIMDVAYSLAPGADLERMLGDVKQALLWMKAHAPEYQVDPHRIVLMGVSGGAHLALLAAYSPGHPAFQRISPFADMSVRAVVSMFGVTDLTAFFREYARSNPKQPQTSTQIPDALRPRAFNKTPLDRLMTRMRAFPEYRYANMPGGALLLVNLLGGTLKEIPEAYRQASPLQYVGPHCPPTLQVFDEQDFVVDASHGRRLHRALSEAGVTSVYLEYPETVHGFDQYIGVSRRISPAGQAVTWELERFLALMV